MKHRYAEMLGWLAEGKPMLARVNGGAEAPFPKDFGPRAIEDVVLGYENWEFRLKPRTVKIGSCEVEAPVLEPVDGQRLWYTSADGTLYHLGAQYHLGALTPTFISEAVRCGRAFASSDAAAAAHAAITALLRGEP